jgi:nicotinamide riboside kinase
MRIALLGPSSTGKTFLAKKMEEVLGVPYVAYETRRWMTELGYASHPEVHAAGPAACMAFQKGLARKRDELFRGGNRSFVTDRCTLDNLVYYWVDDARADTSEGSAEFRSFCLDSFGRTFDVAFLFEFGSIPFKTDGQRVGNPMYHELTQMAYDRVFSEAEELLQGRCFKMDLAARHPRDRLLDMIDMVDEAYRLKTGATAGYFKAGSRADVMEHDYGV